ncbi:MAG: hypothetical protein LBK69_03400 [Syntrophomonadaceae bacterium]|jgi:hypothetical protein|nr:hypothetical protein [Syntrophomonadaceae bacterium]
MSNLHIIGVGGTGHKLAGACVHLAACGAFKGRLGSSEIKSIRIVTIDADAANGNLTETSQLVDSYNKFYEALSGSETLGLVKVEPLSHVKLYRDGKKNIHEAFDIAQYKGSDTDKFVHFLYTEQEIDEPFDLGFYGHTSIGTLVIKDILNHDEEEHDEDWHKFLGGINGDDFVFVAGSIFGGTGASAFPVVLERLKKFKKEKETIKYAALLLTPYFNAVGDIAEEGELQPNSENFQLKAKAALYFYYNQRKYEDADAVYVIGEPKENFSNEAASRGSANQKNKAQPVELFAASAIIDFIKESGERGDQKIITAERGSKDGTFYWTWDMVQNIDAELPSKMQRFMKACVFYNKILYPHLRFGNSSGGWEKLYDNELRTDTDTNNNFTYENVHKFAEKFVSWIYDLHKRNTTEFDQTSGRLKWQPDMRVKLFNASYGALFDNRPVAGGSAKIENFETLVYNDGNSRKSEKIFAEFCDKKPNGTGAKRFPQLFDNLISIIAKEERSLFGRKKSVAENFKPVPYLSKENSVTFVRQETAADKLWSKSEPKLLIDIADGLPFILSDEFTINDISIPSPWSIFIINELTLTEKKFASLNKAAYNQWCGLIALLVLRVLRLYEKGGLKLEQRSLDTVGKFVDTVSKTGIPYSDIFDNPDWSVCHQITLDGEPLAGLAINTIVCPAYSFSDAAKMKLHSMEPSIVNDKGEFFSPDNYYDNQSQAVNRDAKYALTLFLNELKTIITAEAARNKKPIVNSLQKLVEKYIADLGKVTPNPHISLVNADGNIKTVYDIFEKRYIKSFVEQEKPFLLADANRSVALIGLAICGIGSSSPQAATIFVTDSLLYSQINAANVAQKSGTEEDGILLLYDNTLLLDTMAVINKSNATAFNACANRTSLDYEVIWPVSDVLLELYDAERLNNMLFAEKNGDTLTVSLELKLASGKTHVVSKNYTLQTDSSENDSTEKCFIFDRRQLPFWAIWPYCEILDGNGVNKWKRYNCFCGESKPPVETTKVLEVEPLFSGGPQPKEESKLSTISDALRDRYYKRFTALPAALKLKVKSGANGAAAYCGAVFLKPPEQHPANDVVWNIGLDFGTTSTTAFYKTNSGDTDPQFLQLLSEYGWKGGSSVPEIRSERSIDMAILSNSGDVGEDDFKLYFIDDKCLEQNSYITTFEVMDTAKQSQENTIFETGRIFWHNYDNFKVMNATEGRRDNLRTNIKWDVNTSFVGKYLNQLLTQMVYAAASKGVRKINWYFSYPTAFGRGARGEFSATLKTLLKDLADDTGVEINFDKEKNMMTESIAAATYFRKKNVRKQVFLCVDIGGGTSDISIWNKEQNLFQTSIRFASRDMFILPLNVLLEAGEVMSAVTMNRQTEDKIHTMLEYGRTGTANSAEKLKFFTETVLFEYYDTFSNRLKQLEGNDKAFYNNFKYSVFIAYSGLMFYLGNIIAALLQTGDPNKRIDNENAEIVFGLSGKGSKLTNWIDAYCSIIYNGVEKLIEEKTGISLRFNVNFDEKYAKTETAKGLICNLDPAGKQNGTTRLTEPEVFMGGGITLVKSSMPKTYGKDDFILRYEDEYIQNTKLLTPEIDKDLTDFSEFLDFFNQLAGKTQGEMPKIDMDWYESHKKILWNQIKTEFETILKEERFEPPFIVILKVFLDVYNEEYLYGKK